MTFPQTVNYLYKLLPDYQQLGSAAYKPGLANMYKLCAALSEPQRNFCSIHAAGTNGKGSVTSMLAAVLQTAGYKVGLYTSPHLISFCERIKVNGIEITEQAVVDFVEQNRTLIEDVRPSFFELTTAMAFEYFAQQKVEFAVVEAGLGGRLDSTNVLHPVLSVITRIALDHCDLLGNTLEQIATEKAGIIKTQTPVVIGKRQPETHLVFEQISRQCDAPLIFADSRYKVTKSHTRKGIQNFCIEPVVNSVGLLRYARNDATNHVIATHPPVIASHPPVIASVAKQSFCCATDLLGAWQAENICTALTAIDVLRQKITIPDDAVMYGLSNAGKITHLQGRWQILHQRPTVVCDIAHNADGLARTMAQIARYHYRALHIVFGIAADKDLAAILPLLPRNAQYYFTQAQSPRALRAGELAQRCADACLIGKAFDTVRCAYKTAMQHADNEDFIYVGGSAMVVAEVLNNKKPPDPRRGRRHRGA
jgi:dihydrofolate synthase/folylpolyglutamate synthase